jgi:hypothetical protein
VALLRAVGVSLETAIATLADGQAGEFVSEAQDVLRAGLQTSPYASMDDTGARHARRSAMTGSPGSAPDRRRAG